MRTKNQWTRRIAAMFFLALAGCGGCSEREKLDDVRCHPGNPATGRVDPSIVEFPQLCNGLDDNCDGQVDEGCSCRDGDTLTCGVDVGLCRSATVVCAGGQFPPCTPAVSPRPEVCNGVDDDCDGVVDNGIPAEECWDGPDHTVFAKTSSASICRKGQKVCENGRMGECHGQVLPQIEACNRRDDDCNGRVDDIRSEPCGVEIGLCHPGELRCVGGDVRCMDLSTTVHPSPEVCDGKDNNCNGSTDEGLEPIVCQNAQCHTIGHRNCVGGQWSPCDAVGPTPEICGDGIDNNCDGQVDEGCPCPSPSVRVCDQMVVGSPFPDCGYGTQQCTGNGEWGPCMYAGRYPTERCNNHDDNCDGRIDEGLSRRCGNLTLDGVGQCRAGTSSCSAGRWGPCAGEVPPQSEICNHRDDDCNGLVDDGLNPHTKVDMIFLFDISQSMCIYQPWIVAGITAFLGDFLRTDDRFAVGFFPNTLNGWPSRVEEVMGFFNPSILVPAADAQADLRLLHCNGGGFEGSYDALYVATSSANPMHIPWRQNATKYVVLITDEIAQQYILPAVQHALGDLLPAELAIARQTTYCALPGCGPGDRVEVFVITGTAFFQYYGNIVYHEQNRLMDIEPPTATHYSELARSIFRNVCPLP